MGCCNNTCTGEKIYDVCVTYQGNTLNWKLGEDCHNVREVIEDIVDFLTENNNLNNLGDTCLTYGDGKLTQAKVNKKFEDEICELKESLRHSDFPSNFKNCNLNYGDLVDECDKPTNECEFYQFILDKLRDER